MGFVISVGDRTEKELIALKGMIKCQSGLLDILTDTIGRQSVEIRAIAKEIKEIMDIVQATKAVVDAAQAELATVATVLTDIAAAVAELQGDGVPAGTNIQALADQLVAQATAISAANDQLKAASVALEGELTAPPATAKNPEPAPATAAEFWSPKP